MTLTAQQMMAEALTIPIDAVDHTVGLSSTPQWDSLAHFRLVLAIETHLDRKLDPMEIVSLSDLAAVKALVGE